MNEKKYRKEFGTDASIWGVVFLIYGSIMVTLAGNSASAPRCFKSCLLESYRLFEYLPLAETTTNSDRIP